MLVGVVGLGAMGRAIAANLASAGIETLVWNRSPESVRELVGKGAKAADPRFAEKVRGIAGLYVEPPAHAVVLSVDEKSQIQALDRTQPGLTMKKGRVGIMTHDYKRHGTTTRFAAMNVLEGNREELNTSLRWRSGQDRLDDGIKTR